MLCSEPPVNQGSAKRHRGGDGKNDVALKAANNGAGLQTWFAP